MNGKGEPARAVLLGFKFYALFSAKSRDCFAEDDRCAKRWASKARFFRSLSSGRCPCFGFPSARLRLFRTRLSGPGLSRSSLSCSRLADSCAGRAKLVLQGCKGRGERFAFRDDYIIATGGECKAGRQPQGFLEAPPDAVSHRCLAELFGDGETNAGCLRPGLRLGRRSDSGIGSELKAEGARMKTVTLRGVQKIFSLF